MSGLSSALPLGAAVRLNARTAAMLGGQLLVGGAPSRAIRLRPEAALWPTRGSSVVVADPRGRAAADLLIGAGLCDPDPGTLPEQDLGQVTVVIPCYRRPLQLSRLLGSISEELPEVSVLVVDDGSGETSAEIAAITAAHSAQLVVCPENRGPAGARNAGLARVSTPFVLFVDSDVVLNRSALELLLRHFCDPKLAAAAPRVLGLDAGDQNWILDYEQARSSLDHGPHPSLVQPHSPLSWVSTTCLLVRRTAVGDGFSDGLRVAEDVDLIWRLTADGHRVRYEPRAAVLHEHRSTAVGWLGRKYHYGTGAALLAQQHGDWVAPAVLSPWGSAALLALALQRRWSVPAAVGISAAGAVVSLRRLRSAAPEPRARAQLALRLTGYGLSASASQGMGLVVRHWWPAFAAVSSVSRRARRLILAAGVAEAAWEYLRLRPQMDPLCFAAARRLDDAAYGLGVWAGAIRARSWRALRPTRPRPR